MQMNPKDMPCNAAAPASYWEDSAGPSNIDLEPLDRELRCDVVVIGAGYTGMSAALHLALGYGASVCVLDAAYPGWGASGRNGGWACMGSTRLSWPALIRRFGLEAARRFYAIQKDAIGLVRRICKESTVDAELTRDGLLTLAHRKREFSALEDEAEFLRNTFGEKGVLIPREQLREKGWGGEGFHGGLLHPHGFGLHPLRYLRGLTASAMSAGVKVFPASPLESWQRSAGAHVAATSGGRITGDHIVFATNGYTPEAIAAPLRGSLMPIVSTILVTRPLTEEEKKAQRWTSNVPSADTRRLLHYFRLLPDDRFLIGGRGSTDATDAGAERMTAVLRADFERMFPAWKDVEHTHSWHGHICASSAKTPFIGALDQAQTAWAALAYHGNGVAMGTWSGRALAGMLSGDPAALALPRFLTRPPDRFPLPSLRRHYLNAAYVYYGLRDRLI